MASLRSADQLSPIEVDQAAKLAQTREKVAAKVKAAYEAGRRTGIEHSESLLRESAIAQRADHDREIDRVARLWRSNASHMGQARLALGALVGVLFGVCFGWLAHDLGLDRAFEAASDATARGALIGTVQRAAEGK